LIDARAGIVTPLEDPEAVANAIRSVVEHPALAAEFGANGNRYARNNFGWDRLVRNWLLQFIPEAAEVSPQPQIARAS
jgi:glycosyltransferase involved in cell wall biosynthesis